MTRSAAYYPNEASVDPITWADQATESNAIDLGGCALMGVYVPASFEGTTLTMKRYNATADAYVLVTGWSLTVAANQFAYLDTLANAQMGLIKLISDTKVEAIRTGEVHSAKVV